MVQIESLQTEMAKMHNVENVRMSRGAGQNYKSILVLRGLTGPRLVTFFSLQEFITFRV